MLCLAAGTVVVSGSVSTAVVAVSASVFTANGGAGGDDGDDGGGEDAVSPSRVLLVR